MKKFFVLFIVFGANLTAVAQNVTQVEYFLDTDKGIGKNTLVNVLPSPGGNFPFTVNVSGYAAGYHQLYLRTKNDNGLWSVAARRYIEIVPEQTQVGVVSGEYFFDVDPGAGSAAPIVIFPQDSMVMQNFTGVVTSLLPGPHKMYVRFKDSYGNWSHTSRSSVDIIPVHTKNNLTRGEYFFDHEPGFGLAYPFPVVPKDSSIKQSFTASVSGLTPGSHMLYGRSMDSSGNWSQTIRRRVEVVKNSDTDYIVSLEYFFKQDPGFGNAYPVQILAPAPGGTFAFNIPPGNIPSDTDTLFVRAKDSGSINSSITNWKVFHPSGPLPLTLLNFKAIKQGQAILLDWQTENELNTAYFNIQRSTDGTHFTTIGKMNAKGNSVSKSNYSYVDIITGIKDNKLYYRLQEIDRDGKFIYSKIAVVNIEEGNTQFTITPNPASTFINIMPGANVSSTNASVIITDIAGHILIKRKMTIAGNQRIDISPFARGIYTVSVITPYGVQTQKLWIN